MKVLAEFNEYYEFDLRIILDKGKIRVEFKIDCGPSGSIWEQHENAIFPASAKGYIDALEIMTHLIDNTRISEFIEECAEDKDFKENL
jgi:hypothetical protein